MKRFSWKSLMMRYPALFAWILLAVALFVNFLLQPNLFASDTLNSNMRVFLPLILLTAGEAVVILAFVGGLLWGINSVLFIVELCK